MAKFEKIYQSEVVCTKKDSDGSPKDGFVVELQDNGNGTRSLVLQQTYWNVEENCWSYCSPRAGGGKACAVRQVLTGLALLPWLRAELEKVEAVEVKTRNASTTTTKAKTSNVVVKPEFDFSDDVKPTTATAGKKGKAKAQAAATTEPDDEITVLENVSTRTTGKSRVK